MAEPTPPHARLSPTKFFALAGVNRVDLGHEPLSAVTVREADGTMREFSTDSPHKEPHGIHGKTHSTFSRYIGMGQSEFFASARHLAPPFAQPSFKEFMHEAQRRSREFSPRQPVGTESVATVPDLKHDPTETGMRLLFKVEPQSGRVDAFYNFFGFKHRRDFYQGRTGWDPSSRFYFHQLPEHETRALLRLMASPHGLEPTFTEGGCAFIPQLVRPALAPPDLLRPASQSGSRTPDDLLRPSEPNQAQAAIRRKKKRTEQ